MVEKEVVLFAPNSGGSEFGQKRDRENLALACLAGVLEELGASFEVIDARLDDLDQETIVEALCRLQPAIIGITLMGSEAVDEAARIVPEMKAELPGVHVVLGGYPPTLNPTACLKVIPEADSLVLGEGEATFAELAGSILAAKGWNGIKGLGLRSNHRVRVNPRRPLIGDLDSLPKPVRYVPQGQVSKLAFEGSRGCLSSCTFCSIGPQLNPGRGASWRKKSPQRITEELEEARRLYPNVRHYRFVDADFIGSGRNIDVERVKALALSLLRAGFSEEEGFHFWIESQAKNIVSVPVEVWRVLQQTGTLHVFIGVETGSPRMKRLFRKASSPEIDIQAISLLRDLGIDFNYGFMMFTPWSTEEDIRANLQMLKRLRWASIRTFFSELILTPGTDLFQRGVEEGIDMVDTGYIDRYSYRLPEGSLEKTRQVGAVLLDSSQYRPFVQLLDSLHSLSHRLVSQGEEEKAFMLQERLTKINLAIFQTILETYKRVKGDFTSEEIDGILSGIISQYRPEIDSLVDSFLENH